MGLIERQLRTRAGDPGGFGCAGFGSSASSCRFGALSGAGGLCPLSQLRGIFKHIGRHFVVGFERHRGRHAEGFRAQGAVRFDGGLRDFEIEPAFVNDAEERLAIAEPIAAEHRAAGESAQIRQLIQYEFLETVRPGHELARPACAPRRPGSPWER